MSAATKTSRVPVFKMAEGEERHGFVCERVTPVPDFQLTGYEVRVDAAETSLQFYMGLVLYLTTSSSNSCLMTVAGVW